MTNSIIGHPLQSDNCFNLSCLFVRQSAIVLKSDMVGSRRVQFMVKFLDVGGMRSCLVDVDEIGCTDVITLSFLLFSGVDAIIQVQVLP